MKTDFLNWNSRSYGVNCTFQINLINKRKLIKNTIIYSFYAV